MNTPYLLELKNVSKRLGEVQLFENLSFALSQSETVAIVGESGCGKSTLLHIMAGLEPPDSGELCWSGELLSQKHPDQNARQRLHHIGLVFQAYYLMPHLNAIQNVTLPMLLAKQKPDTERATYLLNRVGLGNKAKSLPRELSGGEQQRVAIARALILAPPVLLADEPTGNLDESNADRVLEVLLQTCQTENTALALVTHSEHIASQLHVRRELIHGQLA